MHVQVRAVVPQRTLLRTIAPLDVWALNLAALCRQPQTRLMHCLQAIRRKLGQSILVPIRRKAREQANNDRHAGQELGSHAAIQR